MSIVSSIQSALKAPKGQYNKFGGYYYRSCEDIVEAVKPLLAEHKCHLILTDEVVNIGERYYVKATARIMQDDKMLAESTGFAREAESRKGMDESQLTGACSSYARKYALNGLFAIDDTKDADTRDNRDIGKTKTPKYISEQQLSILRDLLAATESDEAAFTKVCKVESLEKLPANKYEGAHNILLSKQQKMEADNV